MPETIQSAHSFVISDIISTAWHFTKKYFRTVAVLLIIALLPSILEELYRVIIQYIPGATIYNSMFKVFEPIGKWKIISDILSISAWIAGAWLGLWLIKSYFQVLKDKKPDISLMSSTWWEQLAHMIGGWILVALAVIIWALAFVLPGIWIAVRLSLFQYYIAEGYSALDAIKASRYATKGNFWNILGIWFVYVWIALLGFLALGVWLLWALPTIGLAQASIYNKLKLNTPNDLQKKYHVKISSKQSSETEKQKLT